MELTAKNTTSLQKTFWSTTNSKHIKYALELIVFTSGTVVMVLELAGSRVLAPYFGSSIFVWTAIIGVVLTSLSLGYFYGGKAADKNPSFKTLAWVFLISAFYTLFVAFTKEKILGIIQEILTDIRASSVIGSFYTLSLPSFLLGIVFPYSVKLKLKNIHKSGATVGRLYAISTVGSIFGTFLTGFYLISYLGNTKILILTSLVLLGLSFFSGIKHGFLLRNKLFIFLVILLLFLTFWVKPLKNQDLLLDSDTQYGRVLVLQGIDAETNLPIRLMQIDKSTMSNMFLDDHDLVSEGYRFFRFASFFNPDIKNALMLGGAGYSYPKDFLKNFRDSTIDVVEIDPKVTQIAEKYFNLRQDPRLSIVHKDARLFLNSSPKKYGVIYVDVFNPSGFLPFHLTTLEAIEKMYHLLSENGVIIVNIVSTIDGSQGKFVRAEYFTYRRVFPHVFLFSIPLETDPTQTRHAMLVAAKSPPKGEINQEYLLYLSYLYRGKITKDVEIISDDYSPVDQYMLGLVR